MRLKKYAHGFHFIVFSCGSLLAYFTHTRQDCFPGNGTSTMVFILFRPVTSRLLTQSASHAESVFMPRCHHHYQTAQKTNFMGPTWVLSAPDGPHDGPMNLAIREVTWHQYYEIGHGCVCRWLCISAKFYKLSPVGDNMQNKSYSDDRRTCCFFSASSISGFHFIMAPSRSASVTIGYQMRSLARLQQGTIAATHHQWFQCHSASLFWTRTLSTLTWKELYLKISLFFIQITRNNIFYTKYME